MPDPVLDALERVIGELPGGGEAREGQREMADAVRLGIAERKHVAVQAGTGTGKTLAYLVPAILSDAHGRGHRHQGAAGPAGRQGPAVPPARTSATASSGRC